jgi:argininosuccinate lyase
VPYRVNPQSIADLQQAEATAMASMPGMTAGQSAGPMDMSVHHALAKKALGVQ